MVPQYSFQLVITAFQNQMKIIYLSFQLFDLEFGQSPLVISFPQAYWPHCKSHVFAVFALPAMFYNFSQDWQKKKKKLYLLGKNKASKLNEFSPQNLSQLRLSWWRKTYLCGSKLLRDWKIRMGIGEMSKGKHKKSKRKRKNKHKGIKMKWGKLHVLCVNVCGMGECSGKSAPNSKSFLFSQHLKYSLYTWCALESH